jgi:hypothetical protein
MSFYRIMKIQSLGHGFQNMEDGFTKRLTETTHTAEFIYCRKFELRPNGPTSLPEGLETIDQIVS